ncbi:MAG: hypothetical protein ACOYMB_02730 [Patescibacteria group bacterium]
MKITNLAKLLFSLVIFIAIPLSVQAADLTLVDTSNPHYTNGDYQLTDATSFMVRIAGIILQVVGILTFVMFIYGGFMFLISAGNPQTVTTAKKIIIAAIIGLIIVFTSYTLIQFFIGGLTGTANPTI